MEPSLALLSDSNLVVPVDGPEVVSSDLDVVTLFAEVDLLVTDTVVSFVSFDVLASALFDGSAVILNFSPSKDSFSVVTPSFIAADVVTMSERFVEIEEKSGVLGMEGAVVSTSRTFQS